MTYCTDNSFELKVDPPQKHDKDNFTMFVPALNLLVKPHEDRPWTLKSLEEETGDGLGEEQDEFNEIDIKFDGAPTNEIGYQAAVIRFILPDRYEWFGNGLEVISIFEQVDVLSTAPPVRHFRYDLTRKSYNTIVLTIEVEKQVAFESQLNFRFKVIDNEYSKEHGFQQGQVETKVLVSEDPVVKPSRPIDD